MDILTSVMVALFYLTWNPVYCLGFTLSLESQLFSLYVFMCYVSIVMFCDTFDTMVCLYVNNHLIVNAKISTMTSWLQMLLDQLCNMQERICHSQHYITYVSVTFNGG